MHTLLEPVFESIISSKDDLIKLLERNAVSRVDKMSLLFDFMDTHDWCTTFRVKAFWVNSQINVHMINSDGLIIGFVDKHPTQKGL